MILGADCILSSQRADTNTEEVILLARKGIQEEELKYQEIHNLQNTKKLQKLQRRREFAVGFIAALTVLGGFALILLAIFWM